MIRKCLSAECGSDPAVSDFKRRFCKKLYKAGKIVQPNIYVDEHGTLFHITRKGKMDVRKEVVVVEKAKEIVRGLHQPKAEGVCVPGGINTLVRSFTATYYFRGIRKVVKQLLEECTGTCKLSKVLTLQSLPCCQ